MTLTLLHSKMFDVGNLPVLTFGNCVLKTRVIKWLLKLYIRFFTFLTFFFKIQNHDFLRFFELLNTFSRRLVATWDVTLSARKVLPCIRWPATSITAHSL